MFSMFLPVASHALTDATSLKITVHQVAVSLSADCSSPTVIFTSSSASGTESDFITAPTLGSGSLASGTYNCVMITMEDAIKFTTSAAVDGNCAASTEYTIDLCRNTASSGGVALYSTSDVLVGTTATATECSGTAQAIPGGGISNKVTLYLRTTAPANNDPNAQYVTAWKAGNAAIGAADGTNPTTAQPNGIQLASPFVVSGAKTGIFYLDVTGLVDGSQANCQMNPPVFGFR